MKIFTCCSALFYYSEKKGHESLNCCLSIIIIIAINDKIKCILHRLTSGEVNFLIKNKVMRRFNMVLEGVINNSNQYFINIYRYFGFTFQ